MADMATSIFNAIDDLRASDSGSGGLSESTDSDSSAVIRHFVRMGDPDFDSRTANWPLVKVEIICNEQRSYSKRHADALVRFHVYTQRDGLGFAKQSAVNARIHSVYDGIQPSTESPFNFSIMWYVRHFAAPASENELHYVHEYMLRPMS